MSRNNNDSSNNDEPSPRYDADVAGDNYRREPQFSRFDDDDGYEEPDRDTDLASDYRADSVEEEDYEDELPDEDERGLFPAGDADSPDESAASDAQESDTWLEREVYFDEDEEGGRNWPLGLIAMAVVALALLIAGGYGVMQQRAAAQEEIRQLRAALATTASPEDVAASRVALQEMKKSYDELSAIAEAMKLENRRLADTVTGLEAQPGAQHAVLAKQQPEAGQAKPGPATETTAPPSATKTAAPAPTKPATAQPAAATEPATTVAAATSAVAATSGPWFVNFGSYASTSMAESWASKLHPGAGKVVVLANNKGGQTLYRVRVVGLSDRQSAQEVARMLEAQLRVSELWVGKD